VQTFLPYRNYARCAAVLDRQRLGKQRLEARQILSANLRGEGAGWRNHPVTVKWRGFELSLAKYGMAVCTEWSRRGYRDEQYDWFLDRHIELEEAGNVDASPPWITDAMCSIHRAALLGKDLKWYEQFGWTEKPATAYDWTEFAPVLGACPRDNCTVGHDESFWLPACPLCGMTNVWIYGEEYD